MPKTIIVVDDEKLVIFGICSLLADQASSYEIVATCSSGDEAIKFCMEKTPDLLLTDIGMPGMNGLELIKIVRRTNPSMKIAVLSCHDEYELVHKAFMLGAEDYILKKDIDKTQLSQLLDRLLPETGGDFPSDGVVNRITPLSAAQEFVPVTAGSIGIIGFKSENDELLMWQPDIPMLWQLIDDDIKPHGNFFIGFHNDLIIYFSDFGTAEEQQLDLLLTKIRLSVSKYVNRKVFIAKYIMKEGESIIESYMEGLEILHGLFYYNKSTILSVKPMIPEKFSSLKFEISSCNYQSIWFEAAKDFIDTAAGQFVSPEAVKNELVFAVKQLLGRLEEIGRSDISVPVLRARTSYYQKISEFDDAGKLKKWILGFLGNIASELEAGRQTSGVVSNTKNYIVVHLREDLRLSTVANILGSSPNHLSTLFKKNTGQTYIEFVNRKRIEHARELLQTTDLSAKEIAFRCGYTNPNYFSRIFKKITGATISEYRM
ncbi:MAG: response regulator [Spirochaetales bacterium]|nr:response regulator [Spirochaetales bacterium]